MAQILVTGSTDGVGRATAETLLDDGHRVVVHARTATRLTAVHDLLDRGAEAITGDLADPGEVRGLVEQANALGRFDAVIHNAGTMDGPAVLPVNVVAPYVLTARIERPGRLIYLSSSMHRGGTADLASIDWTGKRKTRSYSDSKLYVTTLMTAIGRTWPDVLAHAVDPGWVPTKMGGPGASDDLGLGASHPGMAGDERRSGRAHQRRILVPSTPAGPASRSPRRRIPERAAVIPRRLHQRHDSSVVSWAPEDQVSGAGRRSGSIRLRRSRPSASRC